MTMLKRFSVENYRSFEGRIELRFDESHRYNFNQKAVKNGLLNKVMVVGRNGTGKTNLGLAIMDLALTLTDRVFDERQLDRPSFLNGDRPKDCATFGYVLDDDGRRLEYIYRKADPLNIIYEEFKVDGTTYFVRDGDKGDYDVLRRECAEDLRIDISNGPLSVLKYVWSNTAQKDGSPIASMIRFAQGMQYFRSDLSGTAIGRLSRNGESVPAWIVDNRLEKDFQEFLSAMSGLEVDLDAFRQQGLPSILVQRFKGTGLDFWSIASSGTKNLMLFFFWSKMFDETTFLYMDEFDAYYHFEMAIRIVDYVVSDDRFQTVFTTHNTALMDNDILRPDCYMNLENNTIRSFYRSTDRELRQGHNLEKMYRNGEFDE